MGLGHFSGKLVPVARSLPSNAVYLRHLALSGDDGLVRLASNENTDAPSASVRAALAEAYRDVNLYPPLVSELAVALAARHGVELSQLLITAGSTEVIDATLRTFVRAGDEVVVLTPSWPVLSRRLLTLEARVVEVPLVPDIETWRFDLPAVLAAISPATKLVVLCSPNNPTGNAMSLDELGAVAGTGAPVLIDGAYSDFDPSVDQRRLIRRYENVVLTRTFSKAYSLAGLRLGYALGSSELVGYIERFLVPGTAVSSVALHVGLAALADEAHYRQQLARVADERGRLMAEIRGLGLRVWQSKANFVSIDTADEPGGAEALADAIRAHGVVVRPLGRLVRISIGRKPENDALIVALRAVRNEIARIAR